VFGIDLNGRKSIFAIYVNSKPPGHASTENRRYRALSHRRLHATFPSGTWKGLGVDINGQNLIFGNLYQLSTTHTCQQPTPVVQGHAPHFQYCFPMEISFMSTPNHLDVPASKTSGPGHYSITLACTNQFWSTVSESIATLQAA
jgi:hypothetical protein